jgi:hypothetical protein
VSMSPEQLEAEALKLPIRERAAGAHRLLEGLAETEDAKARYTPKQGQYLSFIHYYTTGEVCYVTCSTELSLTSKRFWRPVSRDYTSARARSCGP